MEIPAAASGLGMSGHCQRSSPVKKRRWGGLRQQWKLLGLFEIDQHHEFYSLTCMMKEGLAAATQNTIDNAPTLLLHHDGPVHRPHNCGRCTNPPVNLTLHLSLTREQDPEILELLHLRQDLSTHPERARHPFPVENHGLGFGGADSHPSRFTLGCKPLQYMLKVLALMKPTGQHHLQKAEMKSCGSQTGLPPAPPTGPVTKGSPAGVQHALGTEACQPRQPHNIQRLEVLRADLIHPRRLATKELANYLSDFGLGDSPSPHLRVPSLRLPAQGKSNELSDDDFRLEVTQIRKDFTMATFAGPVFASLRGSLGITEQEYQQSLCSENCYLQFISNSKSKADFFLTNDKRFFLKTQNKREIKFLLANLKIYMEHLRKYPHSLVVKFLGTHVTHRHRHLHTMTKYFIVMQSVFYPDDRINARYDIKGCEVSRWTEPAPEGSQIIVVLKDLNFEGQYITLDRQRPWLLRQVEIDTRFLQRLNVLDYSLLLAHQPLHNDERHQSLSFATLIMRTKKSVSL
ncbi:hypothetical protein L3Q82_012189, partial [Scortum barcoo]